MTDAGLTVNETIERVARDRAGFVFFQKARDVGRDKWVEMHWQEYASLLDSFVEALDFHGYDILPHAQRKGTDSAGQR